MTSSGTHQYSNACPKRPTQRWILLGLLAMLVLVDIHQIAHLHVEVTEKNPLPSYDDAPHPRPGFMEQLQSQPKRTSADKNATMLAEFLDHEEERLKVKKEVSTFLETETKKLISQIDSKVSPATNLSFGGPSNNMLYVTAGVPRLKNCQLLKILRS